MIRHHLKDGTVLDDITGHLVKKEDVPRVYALIDQMNHERERAKRYEGKYEGFQKYNS